MVHLRFLWQCSSQTLNLGLLASDCYDPFLRVAKNSTEGSLNSHVTNFRPTSQQNLENILRLLKLLLRPWKMSHTSSSRSVS